MIFHTERAILPLDAPRLFCILGDLEKSPSAYQRAWDVSQNRYARAQRSLGSYYLARNDLPRAEEAYVQSLKINPQNHSIWFALGSVRLRSEHWEGAAEAFRRAIQLEETDAESWSNLAAALLSLGSSISSRSSTDTHRPRPSGDSHDGEVDDTPTPAPDSENHVREAFVALKRAAVLKRDSYRIWQNLLLVATKLSPPPLIDIVIAQSRLIDLLGKTEGERCIDVEVMEGLLAHLISSSSSSTSNSFSPPPPPSPIHSLATANSIPNGTSNSTTPTTDSSQSPPPPPTPSKKPPGFPKLLTDLIQNRITPLITTSRRLWLLTAKLSLYQHRPAAALATYEKAWRATLNQPGWESGPSTGPEATTTQLRWNEVVDATIDLVDAYESLGEREHERGREVVAAVAMGEGVDKRMGAGTRVGGGTESESGTESGMKKSKLVCKEWKFKARSAIRGVLGRAREGWGESEGEDEDEKGDKGWRKLEARFNELREK